MDLKKLHFLNPPILNSNSQNFDSSPLKSVTNYGIPIFMIISPILGVRKNLQHSALCCILTTVYIPE